MGQEKESRGQMGMGKRKGRNGEAREGENCSKAQSLHKIARGENADAILPGLH